MAVEFICDKCGSDEVTSDTVATWDKQKQRWAIVGHYDSSECRRCGCETSLIEVESRIAVTE